MSTYSAEDPEGRATDTAAWRDRRDAEARDAEAHDTEASNGEVRDDAAAAGARSEPSTADGGNEAADPDVIVLEEAGVVVLDEEPHDSGTYAGAGAVDPVSPVRDADQGADPGPSVSGQDREFPRADVAADTGPELSSAGSPGAGPELTNAGAGTGPGLTGADAAAANGPMRTSTSATGAGPDVQGAPAVAAPAARTAQLQERWLAIQSDFVDDPRRSVTSAADLVTEAIDTLVAEIKERDASLRETWDSSNADTEVLRNALRDYRSFLDHLVAL
jgi:hypothetical protein